MRAHLLSHRRKRSARLATACLCLMLAFPAASMAQRAGAYRNPVTFFNTTNQAVRVRWIYEPVPAVVSVLTIAPGENGFLPMPPAAKMGRPLNLLISTATSKNSFAVPLPVPGQPGPISIQIDDDMVLRLTPVGAARQEAHATQKGGFPLRPSLVE